MSAQKICFFIAPIGEDKSEDRDRSDQVRDYLVRPIAEKFGYKVIRADEISKSGIITSQVIEYLFESSLVVAYLATGNPNVFYELALRHAVRKPFVQVIEEGQKIPFDVSALRTIHLKYGDYRSLEKCKSELSDQIESLEKDPDDVDSPVSQAIDVKALRESNKPFEQGLAQVIGMVEALRDDIAALGQVPSPANFVTASIYDPNRYSAGPTIPTGRMSDLGNPTFLSNVFTSAPEKPKAPVLHAKAEPTNPTKKGQK
jgi:hypothetical protein